MARRTLYFLAAALVLPLLAFAALYFFVQPEKMRPLVEKNLSSALARPVRLGTLSFRLLPLSFSTQKLEIAEDPAFGGGAFASAENLEIRPSFWPLLRGNVEITSVTVDRPRVELRQNAAKQWNWSSLGRQRGAASSPLQLDLLEIREATVGLSRPGAPRLEYQRLGLKVTGYDNAKPFGMALVAQMADGAAISAEGRIAYSPQRTRLEDVTLLFAGLRGKLQGEVAGDNLDLQVEIPSSPLAEAGPLFLPKGTNVKGQITAKLAVRGTSAAPRLEGKLAVESFEASGGQIQQPVRTKLLSLELSPERISLLPAEVVSGSTKIQAWGVVANYASAPLLEATLLAPAAQLPELLGIARAYGVSGLEGVSAQGQLRLQIRAHGPLQDGASLQFNGSGALQNATLQLPALTRPLQIKAADFRFAQDSVDLQGVDAAIGSTHATGSLKVTQFAAPRLEFAARADRLLLGELRTLLRESKSPAKPTPLEAKGRVEIGRFDLEQLLLEKVSADLQYSHRQILLNPLRATVYGGQQSGILEIDLRPAQPLYHLRAKLDKVETSALLQSVTPASGFVSGPLAADLDLRFSPAEPASFARSLNGKLALRMANGRIAGFNMTNELAAVARFLGYRATSEAFTQFLSLGGDLDVAAGVARTQNLKLDLANLSSTISGSINLVDQSLDLKVLSLLDRRFSDQVGGTRIGGFMTAALANGQGNLLIPATIKGSFQKPVMAPDTGAMAQLKLQNLNPKDPQQLMNQMESILGIFRKKP